MVETKELILKLKEVREQKGLSLNEIVSMVEENGDYVSRSSIQRVFSDGSETLSFRYEETIRPIAKALLDMETIEEGDNMDIQAMKTLLKYKIQRIEELERQIEHLEAEKAKDKLKNHEKIDNIRTEYEKKIGISVLMCPYSSTACGVKIAMLSGTITPFIVIPIAMGVTSPSSGIWTFACTLTLYLANLPDVLPFRLRTPTARGTTFPVLQGIETVLNGMVPLRATNASLVVTYSAIAHLLN